MTLDKKEPNLQIEKPRARIFKCNRTISPDGTQFVEKQLSVEGETIKEITPIFDKRWKDE